MNQIKFYSHNSAHAYLSNFWYAPMTIEGQYWPTVEHYYQPQKTHNQEEKEIIRLSSSPSEAKRLGKECKMRPDWDSVKDYIMMRVVLFKFIQHPELLQQLLETGDAYLIEDSPTDYYWGCGADGTGKNQLGETLMLIRKVFRA